jgi:hypothetical protein
MQIKDDCGDGSEHGEKDHCRFLQGTTRIDHSPSAANFIFAAFSAHRHSGSFSSRLRH